jgi:hypothetical protein
VSPTFDPTKKDRSDFGRADSSLPEFRREYSGAPAGLPLYLRGSATSPLTRYQTAGVSTMTYEEIARAVNATMKAPGYASSTGRATFNRKPADAKAMLYHTHFRDDAERLSFAYGVFEAYLVGVGEGSSDDLFGMLFNYEIARARGSGMLVVHEAPTPDEIRQLEPARAKEEVASAERWEAGARDARMLLDVTQFATPAKSHADPLITSQNEPRKPMSGSIAGYLFGAAALEPRDLLVKSDFRLYATAWEQEHSAILSGRGFSPVVEAATPIPALENWPGVAVGHRLLGYIGYVTADSIYVSDSDSGAALMPTDRLAAALAGGLPVYAFANIGSPLEKQTGYGGAEFLVSTDVNGRVLQVWNVGAKAEPPIESVASPIDFFGPKLVLSAGRAVGGLVAEGAATARTALGDVLAERTAAARLSLGRMAQKGAFWLGTAMKGAGELPALTMEETPAAFVLGEEGGAMTVAEPSQIATSTASRLTPDLRTTADVFGEIHVEMGLEAPGTITYPSTAAAAAAATAVGLHSADRPGFQTHSTAPSVRRVLGLSGNQWQSVHMLMQAAYRALRARGYVPPGGQAYSPGRALTTVDLPLAAHRAFDAGWVPLWNAAVASGQRITAGQVYEWLSNAINSVSPSLINSNMQGIILARIRTELFVELGLNWNDPIVP